MKEDEDRYQAIDGDMIYNYVFGVMDVLRPESKETVKKCQQSGINVRMVTGDN